MKDPTPLSSRTRVIVVTLLALLGVEFAYHLWLAAHIPIDYYDGFDYLINGRFLAGRGDWFEGVRPPLVSLLQVPWFLGSDPAPWRGPHGTTVVLSYLALLPVYALARRGTSPLVASTTVLLFAGSRIFFRYSPFVMGDLLGTGLTAAMLALFLSGRESERPARHFLAMGIAGGLALLTRHPLGILGFFVLGFEILESLRDRTPTPSLRRPSLWLGAALPLALFAGVMVVIFGLGLGWSPVEALTRLGEMARSQAEGSGITARTQESTLEYVRGMLAIWGPVTCLAVVAGTVGALLRGSETLRLHALWFLANFVLFSLVISRRETRYLLPAIPSALVLALVAFGHLRRRAVARGPLMGRIVTAGIGLGVALPLLGGVVTEVRVFSHPIYREPFLASVTEDLEGLLEGPGRLLVVGDKYALHPEGAELTAGDDYYYFHHLTERSFEYQLDREVHLPEVPLPGDGSLAFPALLDWAAPGDVIVALEPTTFSSMLIPSTKQPLRIARLAADRMRARAEGSCSLFESPALRIEACPEGMTIEAPSPVEIYVPGEARFESLGWFLPGHTKVKLPVPPPTQLMVARYDRLLHRCPPGTTGRELEAGPELTVGFGTRICVQEPRR